jgi:hypothetical protein
MNRDVRTQVISGVLLVASLVGSIGLSVDLSAQASRAKISYTDRAEDGAPWEVSAGIAMGAFRGIFVNFLWLRANQMKEDGKFFESIELARIITRLQPRFPRVWVFHAWNLAYNISVETQTREERWDWVNQGISILRDHGIPANPNDMLLHKELGWIFLHKIGGFTDDANPYYKQELAREWTIVLGPPPPREPGDRDKQYVVNKYVARLRKIADAPDTREQLWTANPKVKELADRLVAIGIRTDVDLLQRYEVWRASKGTSQRRYFEASAGEKLSAMGALVDDAAYAEAWDQMLCFVRKRILIDQYHMDPERMIRYTQTYGPLDWRHHAAHALYWSAKGVELGEARVDAANRRDFDFLNTDRVLVQSIQDLFRSGDVYFDFFTSMFPGRNALWKGAPNLHFVEAYGEVLDPMRERGGAFADVTQRGWTQLSSGYENFLRDVICFYYARGDRANAERYHHLLLTHPGINVELNRLRLMEDAIPLDAWVEKELNDQWTRPAIAILQTEAALQGAFTGGLLAGDLEVFARQMDYAKIAHRIFFENQARFTSVDPNQERMRQLPKDIRIMAGLSFMQFMSGLGIDDAEKVYDRAPDDLRAFAYDFLVERYKADLDELSAQAGDKGARSFAAIFPEPRALAEARAARDAYFNAQAAPAVEMESK